jgi:hypothetical protein
MALLIGGLVLLALCLSGTAWAKGYVYITLNEGFLYGFDASNYSQVLVSNCGSEDSMTASDNGLWLYLAGPHWINCFNTTGVPGSQIEKTIPYDLHSCALVYLGDA